MDALVVSRPCASAISHIELDRIKQKASTKIFDVSDPPFFQIEIADGQLQNTLATTTLQFDFRDNTFPERFVVIKMLTGPLIGLHSRRHSSVIIHHTHGLIRFPHLTMRDRNAASKTSAKTQSVLTGDTLTI